MSSQKNDKIKTFHPRAFKPKRFHLRNVSPESDTSRHFIQEIFKLDRNVIPEVTDTLTHFHPGNFHQRQCHPRTSDKIKTFHPKRFHPRNAIPESDEYQDISSKRFPSQTQMSSQKVTDTLTRFHPISFNPRKCHLSRSDIWWHVIHEILSLKPATACMKNFSSKKLDDYILVKRFGMERLLVSFSQLFTVLMRQYSFIHSSLVADPLLFVGLCEYRIMYLDE